MNAREHTQRGSDIPAAKLIRHAEFTREWHAQAIAEARAEWGPVEPSDPTDRRRHLTLIDGGLADDAVVDRYEHTTTALRNCGMLA